MFAVPKTNVEYGTYNPYGLGFASREKLYFLAERIEELIIYLAMSVALNSFNKVIYVTKVPNSKKQYAFRCPYLFNCSVVLIPEFGPLNLICKAFSHPFTSQGWVCFFFTPEEAKKAQENLHFN